MLPPPLKLWGGGGWPPLAPLFLRLCEYNRCFSLSSDYYANDCSSISRSDDLLGPQRNESMAATSGIESSFYTSDYRVVLLYISKSINLHIKEHGSH